MQMFLLQTVFKRECCFHKKVKEMVLVLLIFNRTGKIFLLVIEYFNNPQMNKINLVGTKLFLVNKLFAE